MPPARLLDAHQGVRRRNTPDCLCNEGRERMDAQIPYPNSGREIVRQANAPAPLAITWIRARLGWIVGAVAVATCVGIGAWLFFGNAAPVRYVTAAVTRGSVSRAVTSTGAVN